MNNVVLHIPHSSTKVPKWYLKRCLLNYAEMMKFVFLCADLYTDDLFDSAKCTKIKFDISRIVCDVEKYSDDNKEIASRYGLGYVYSKDYDDNNLIEITDNYKEYIYNKLYSPYHKHATLTIKKLISNDKDTIIVDCHSFSKKVPYVNSNNYPDICIGFNSKFSSEILNDYTYDYFVNRGYKCSINQPFDGSFVPLEFYEGNINNLYSIMLEINKELYLDSNNNPKDNYNKLKSEIAEYIRGIQNLKL